MQLSVIDPAIATVTGSAVIPAGATEVIVVVSGDSTGATTIAATSSRGDAWSIASVSPIVAKTLSADAMPVGAVVVPTRLLGQVYAGVNGQTTITVPILGNPAVIETPVSVTSTNGAVASVVNGVSIAPGSQSATLTITGGIAGTATLTVRAGAEFGQLTIVVGAPSVGSVPPILARPAGIVVVPAPSAGRLFTAPAGQATFNVRLLSNPAAATTPVTVSSSDAAVASVLNPGVIALGSDSLAVTVSTGVQGTATLVFRAGGETREVTVVVGTPAAGTVPPILARPAGIVLLAAPSAGRLFTGIAAQSTVTVQLLSSPATAPTPVSFSSSNANVASIVGPVVIPPGAIGASVTVATGIEGTATLTFTGGGQTRELTVVVGTPPPGTVPPVLARPVGVVMIPQRQLGSVFSAIGAPASVNLTLLSAPSASPVPVIVTSSDPNVAAVTGDVIIPAGSRIASVNIAAGAQGVATFTLRAGSELAQIHVVVGTPPAAHLPLIVAPIVGVSVKQ